ncbi:hypothetical protein MYP_4110 [Sporocytophaga myxococcoides]|uniref:Uncharacterized protein n=1 Tax=Sporocytophaga myxococcoides TaxID=153721 RepID=A0A098LIW0_9BACT|nr:hypothetical protein [Sporocytophaga myxococcoides]GAL86880.1 hypothetical protein MYP_4110 [Sporocytophaga myxococcoides]
MTFFTVKKLSKAGYIQYNPQIDLSFQDERDLPAEHFLRRAAYFNKYNKPQLAFAEIDKVIEKNNGRQDCETLFLLCDAFAQTAQYEKFRRQFNVNVTAEMRSGIPIGKE